VRLFHEREKLRRRRAFSARPNGGANEIAGFPYHLFGTVRSAEWRMQISTVLIEHTSPTLAAVSSSPNWVSNHALLVLTQDWKNLVCVPEVVNKGIFLFHYRKQVKIINFGKKTPKCCKIVYYF
jgi:hypothetical protein